MNYQLPKHYDAKMFELAMICFEYELNKQGERKTLPVSQTIPHGFRKHYESFVKGYTAGQKSIS